MKYTEATNTTTTSSSKMEEAAPTDVMDVDHCLMSELEFSSDRCECPHNINIESATNSSSFLREIGMDESFFSTIDEESGEIYTVPLSPPTGGKDLHKMSNNNNHPFFGSNSTSKSSDGKIGRLNFHELALSPSKRNSQQSPMFSRRDPLHPSNSPNQNMLQKVVVKLQTHDTFSSEVMSSLAALSKLSCSSRMHVNNNQQQSTPPPPAAVVVASRADCYGRFEETNAAAVNSTTRRYIQPQGHHPQNPVRASYAKTTPSTKTASPNTRPLAVYPPPTLKSVNVRKKRRSILPVTLTASMHNQLIRILEKLMKHRWAFVFNHPVDPVALNIPDYFQIIKYPMDLTTVKNKLRRPGTYKTVGDFCVDVNRVWSNALKYNPKGNDVHIMAQTLQKYFQRLIKHLDQTQSLYSQLPQTTCNQPTNNMSYNQLHNKNRNVRQNLSHQNTYSSIPSVVKDNFMQQRLLWGNQSSIPQNGVTQTTTHNVQTNHHSLPPPAPVSAIPVQAPSNNNVYLG